MTPYNEQDYTISLEKVSRKSVIDKLLDMYNDENITDELMELLKDLSK